MQSQNIQLYYLPVRGRGQIIKLFLSYCQIDYQIINYNSLEEWFKVKETLTNDFKNVPYIKDGDFELTETQAIISYIINKYKPELKGSDIQDIARVDQINGKINDIFKDIVELVLLPDFDSQRLDKFESKFKSNLSLLDEYIKGKYIRCDQLFSCDLFFFELYEWLQSLFPEQMSGFSKLQSVYNNIKALPQIQKYLSSQNYIKRPFISPDFTQWKQE